MTVVFVCSNILFVHSAETNFWANRRQTADKLRGTGASSVRDENARQILGQLPGVAHIPIGLSLSLSVGSGLSSTPRMENPANIPVWISQAILPWGSIREMSLSKTPDAPLIIHVQDAHGIVEAQKNTASMIEFLSGMNTSNPKKILLPTEEGHQKPDVGRSTLLVGLEAAKGAFNMAPYRDWPDVQATRDVAEYFLEEGKIGGAEYAAITAKATPVLWGIENADMYQANVKALKDSLQTKPALQKVLSEMKRVAEKRKETVYSPTLKEYDAHFQSYKTQKGSSRFSVGQ